MITCSKLYMKSIESAAAKCEDQDLAAKFNHALTFWHLSHICMLSKDKSSVVPELVQWLDENFLQSQQEEMMLGHLLRESSESVDPQAVWYLCQHFLIRGRRDLASKVLTKHPNYAEMSDIQQLQSLILSPEISKRAAELVSSTSSPQVSQILRILSGDVRAIQSVEDKKNSWHAMMSLMLQFNQPALTRRCFLDSRSRGYSYQQKGKRLVEQCFDAKVPSWRTNEQYEHLKMYLKILAQDEQSVMTTFVRLGLPWMTAHMSDLLAHCGQLQKLPADLPERINLVEQLGGNDCGHAQRAVYVEDYVSSLLGDSNLWEIALTYAKALETKCGKGSSLTTPPSRNHVRELMREILEHVPVDTEHVASRAFDLATRYGIDEAARTLSLCRASHLRHHRIGSRGGNSALWLLKASAGETLNSIALKYLNECVVRLEDEETSAEQKQQEEETTTKTCEDVLKDMHTLLSSVSICPDVIEDQYGIRLLHRIQQLLLVENDIKMFGPEKLVMIGGKGSVLKSNLAREASKHLIGILSDEKLPECFAWPLLCMSMPYLRIRSFSSDMVAVLMRHLEETNTKNDRKPYVIRGSMSLDSEALKRWGLNSKRDSKLQVSFVTTLRLELARNLSKSLLCPFEW